MTHLRLTPDEATALHRRYLTDYGLAIAGLVQHHSIDPMEFNTLVDDALPLDGVITPDPALKKLLEDMDKSKIKLWALTNAYVTHARRVLRLLGVEALFEGFTYCDYAQWPLVCKPMGEMFEKAEREAGLGGRECFFVGMNPPDLSLSLSLFEIDLPPSLLSALHPSSPPQKKYM